MFAIIIPPSGAATASSPDGASPSGAASIKRFKLCIFKYNASVKSMFPFSYLARFIILTLRFLKNSLFFSKIGINSFIQSVSNKSFMIIYFKLESKQELLPAGVSAASAPPSSPTLAPVADPGFSD